MARDALKYTFLGNVSPENESIIRLDPVLAHIKKEMNDMLPKLLPVAQINEYPLRDELTHSQASDLLLLAIRNLFDIANLAEIPTVADIAHALEEHLARTRPDLHASDYFDALQRCTVAALGWVTLLFSWADSPDPRFCAIQCAPSPTKTDLHIEIYGRSIDFFMNNLGLAGNPYKGSPDVKDLLHSSLLNLHSLIYVGRLQILWVPHLSQHLVLDLPTQTLRLFRYPSICALALSDGDYEKLSRRLMNDPDYGFTHDLYREVLLSLRFLLGKTRKSRNLAKKVALSAIQYSERDALFDALLDGKIDHLLVRPSAKSTEKHPVMEDFLTPWTDFPLLGERLLKIQQYNEQQRPTSTMSMIRDRRNPAQCYDPAKDTATRKKQRHMTTRIVI